MEREFPRAWLLAKLDFALLYHVLLQVAKNLGSALRSSLGSLVRYVRGQSIPHKQNRRVTVASKSMNDWLCKRTMRLGRVWSSPVELMAIKVKDWRRVRSSFDAFGCLLIAMMFLYCLVFAVWTPFFDCFVLLSWIAYSDCRKIQYC